MVPDYLIALIALIASLIASECPRAGESALWWCSGKGGGRWFCGGSGLIGNARGSFASGRTAALRPIDVPEGAWRVADGSNGWKDVPSVRLLTEAAMAQVIAANCS